MNQGGTADITVLESLTFKTVFLIIRGNYMYCPSLEMLEKLDLKSYDLVPIKKEIYSDMITPIELMRKLKQYSKHVYMLESHEDKTKWGRYTFIGFDPKSEITCYNKMMKVDDKIFKVTHPKEYIRKVLNEHRSLKLEGFPTFTGGLVGYFSFDYFKYSEPSIIKNQKDNGFNDVDLMLFDKVICFDHFKQKLILIVNIGTNDLQKNYKEGIKELLEMVLLTAEVMELKANPNRAARGLVIEAELDKGKGPVATILVQKGTLKVGDSIAAGACSGKVRAMMDDKGKRVKEAGPSTPVEILGLSDVPNAGEILVATENDKEAKSFAATFVSENKNRLLEETKAKMSLDDLFSQIQAGNLKELPIIVKADVQGSVEAVKQSLVKLSNEEVVVKVIHGGVGAITESDVSLASASNAIIIGFNVRPDATAKTIADQEGVDVRLYKVIYQAIEDVEAAMKGMLDPVYEEKVIGHAEVRQTFKASGVGTIAGGYVLDGIFQRNCKVRITRGEEQIYEGNLASLKRFKDDVKEVKAGYECGLVFEDFNDIQEEDKVEAYIMVEVPR